MTFDILMELLNSEPQKKRTRSAECQRSVSHRLKTVAKFGIRSSLIYTNNKSLIGIINYLEFLILQLIPH